MTWPAVALVWATEDEVEIRWTDPAPPDLLQETASWPHRVVTRSLRTFPLTLWQRLDEQGADTLSIVDDLVWAALATGYVTALLWMAVRAAKEGKPVHYDREQDVLTVFVVPDPPADIFAIPGFWWREVEELFDQERFLGVRVQQASTLPLPGLADLLVLAGQQGMEEPDEADRSV